MGELRLFPPPEMSEETAVELAEVALLVAAAVVARVGGEDAGAGVPADLVKGAAGPFELVGVVGRTMQPAHASIWLRQGGEG